MTARPHLPYHKRLSRQFAAFLNSLDTPGSSHLPDGIPPFRMPMSH